MSAMTSNVITRSEAKVQGLARYFTGASCSNGHVSERRTKNAVCLVCVSEARTRWAKTPRGRKMLAAAVARYTQRNPAKVALAQRECKRRAWLKNRDVLRERHKAYRNRPSYKAWYVAYRTEYDLQPENAARMREARRRYRLERYHEDPTYRLATRLRRRIRDALTASNASKVGSAVDLLGCSPDEARAHIESLFAEGMTWANHGEWHIDHKRPLASFNLSDLAELAMACNYKNLQPLWAKDNRIKGASLS